MKIFLNLQILFALFLFGCLKSKELNELDKKTLNLALSSELSTIDPAISYDGISSQIVYQVFETLYEYDYKMRPYTLRPLLAQDFPTISKDKTKYLIKIKKDVFYNDNPCFKGNRRSLKALDFINQLKRLAFAPTKSTGYWLLEGKIKGIDDFRKWVGSDFEKFKKLEVEGLKVIDDYTFSIELTRPYPQILYALSMSFTSPLPMEAIEFYKNDFSTNAVGTGPFYVEKLNMLGDIVLLKNRSYHGPPPDFEKIHFHLIKEDQPRWLNFLSKKLDIISVPVDNFSNVIDPKTGSLKQDLQEKEITLYKGPTLTYWWLSFNMKDPLLGKNKYLRLAIASAINRKKFIELFTNGLGIEANSLIPKGVLGHRENIPSFHYDKNAAKLFLEKAGYPNGQGLASIKLDTRSTSTKARQQAEFIKKELEEIGIKIRIETNTFPSFLAKARDGNLQFFFDGWAMDYPDAENSLALLSKKNFPPGPNATFYHNKNFEKLFAQFSQSSGNTELVKKMEEIVFNDLPWVLLYYDQKIILTQKKVKNFIPSDLVNNYLKYLKSL